MTVLEQSAFRRPYAWGFATRLEALQRLDYLVPDDISMSERPRVEAYTPRGSKRTRYMITVQEG